VALASLRLRERASSAKNANAATATTTAAASVATAPCAAEAGCVVPSPHFIRRPCSSAGQHSTKVESEAEGSVAGVTATVDTATAAAATKAVEAVPVTAKAASQQTVCSEESRIEAGEEEENSDEAERTRVLSLFGFDEVTHAAAPEVAVASAMVDAALMAFDDHATTTNGGSISRKVATKEPRLKGPEVFKALASLDLLLPPHELLPLLGETAAPATAAAAAATKEGTPPSSGPSEMFLPDLRSNDTRRQATSATAPRAAASRRPGKPSVASPEQEKSTGGYSAFEFASLFVDRLLLQPSVQKPQF